MFTNAESIDQGVLRLVSQANSDITGLLSFEELVAYFNSRGVAMEDDRSLVKGWMAEVDYTMDGKLDKNELKMWGIARVGLRGDIRVHMVDKPIDDGIKSYFQAVNDFNCATNEDFVTLGDVKSYNAVKGTATSEIEIQLIFKSAGAGITTGSKLTHAMLREWVLANMGVQTFIKRMISNAKVMDDGINRIFAQCKLATEGQITMNELVNYLSDRGVCMEDDRQHVETFFKEVDFKKDNALDFSEIKMWAIARVGVRGDLRSYIQKKPTLDEGLRDYFDAVQAVDRSENKAGITVMSVSEHTRLFGTAAPMTEIQLFIKDANTSNTGVATFDEVRDWCLRTMGVSRFIKRNMNNGKDQEEGILRLFKLAGAEDGEIITKDTFCDMLRSRGVAMANDCRHSKVTLPTSCHTIRVGFLNTLLQALFDSIDTNGDGQLDRKELLTWATAYRGVEGEFKSLMDEAGESRGF